MIKPVGGFCGQFSKRMFFATAMAASLMQIGASGALAAPKASSLSCPQMKSMIQKRGKVHLFTRRGRTYVFANNAGICQALGMQLNYYSVIDKSGKYCTLRRCSSGGFHGDYGR